MFSPLNINIKASRYFRFYYYGCLLFSGYAVSYSDISFVLSTCLIIVLLILARFYAIVPPVERLIWDLDEHSIRLLCVGEVWYDGLKIEKIHLLPYLYFFKLRTKSGKNLSLCFFPDSVSVEDYRRLRVALKIGKMTLEPKATHS